MSAGPMEDPCVLNVQQNQCAFLMEEQKIVVKVSKAQAQGQKAK